MGPGTQPSNRPNNRESGLTEEQERMLVAEYGPNTEKLSGPQKELLYRVWNATVTRKPAGLTPEQSAEVVRMYGIINPDDKDLNIADFQHRKDLRLRIRLRELGLVEGSDIMLEPEKITHPKNLELSKQYARVVALGNSGNKRECAQIIREAKIDIEAHFKTHQSLTDLKGLGLGPKAMDVLELLLRVGVEAAIYKYDSDLRSASLRVGLKIRQDFRKESRPNRTK